MPNPIRKKTSSPALWAGLECTLNRVGDSFHDQCARNGHDLRLDDLRIFNELGIERLRYPCLWEKAVRLDQPNQADQYDWRLFDERLGALRQLNLKPVVGLLHHGSGPPFTNLLDCEFPVKFARYARAFAERYPWVQDYTPVNEPLTTARFSGLYGVWYPQQQSDKSFVRALYHQIEGTRLAMLEIRKVNPDARLIQTEDLGRASATPGLQYQALFENERRWLTFDLLAGRVGKLHPMWTYLTRAGIEPGELELLQQSPCPADIIGLNHYLLSNRFLDHRLQDYPEVFYGGNGIDRYADVGAVDCEAAELPSVLSILKETWQRYRMPLAITEVHLSGGRESQMRWLHEVWTASMRAIEFGADVRAVTVWSLLGSFDWNSLCTQENGFYESGIFDVRARGPRPTKLNEMAAELAKRGNFTHPLLDDIGWWRTSLRNRFPKMALQPTQAKPKLRARRRLMIAGNGTLGKAFARICEQRRIPFHIFGREHLDITDMRAVRRALDEHQPWAFLNATGFADVDRAELEPENCRRDNVDGPAIAAEACAEKKVAFITFSSDLVFGGGQNIPYVESSAVGPLSVYGHSKVQSEQRVASAHPDSLIVRTSSFFGPWDGDNFVSKMLHKLRHGQPVITASDVRISPTYVPDLVHACLDLLIDGEKGILHLTNDGELSWSELAELTVEVGRRLQRIKGELPAQLLMGRPRTHMPWQATRPHYSALTSERVNILPKLENSMERYFFESNLSELFLLPSNLSEERT